MSRRGVSRRDVPLHMLLQRAQNVPKTTRVAPLTGSSNVPARCAEEEQICGRNQSRHQRRPSVGCSAFTAVYDRACAAVPLYWSNSIASSVMNRSDLRSATGNSKKYVELCMRPTGTRRGEKVGRAGLLRRVVTRAAERVACLRLRET